MDCARERRKGRAGADSTGWSAKDGTADGTHWRQTKRARFPRITCDLDRRSYEQRTRLTLTWNRKSQRPRQQRVWIEKKTALFPLSRYSVPTCPGTSILSNPGPDPIAIPLRRATASIHPFQPPSYRSELFPRSLSGKVGSI